MPVWSVTTLPDSLNIDAIRRGAVNRRAPLHPLDQFWAFMALREKCESDEEVATVFLRLGERREADHEADFGFPQRCSTPMPRMA